ncbi:MAG: BrnA antitoxin family protein [Bryobacteraceae bacterium]
MKREYDFSKAKRGPVIPVPKGTTRITIRLDEDVVAWFRSQAEKAAGGNYQSLLNDTLRQYIANTREPLEETLRRVVREEIRRAS